MVERSSNSTRILPRAWHFPLPRLRVLSAFLAVLIPLSVPAQWTEQVLRLRPGWNSAYLEVQPAIANTATVFAGKPVESVWKWNRRLATGQFATNTSNLDPRNGDWLVYWPPSSELGARGSAESEDGIGLHALIGGSAYLIRVATNASPFDLKLQGRPVAFRPEWLIDSFHLVGFPLGQRVSPSDYFAGSSAHAHTQNRDTLVFRLAPSGQWTASRSDEALVPGEAYWVYSRGASKFAGPIEVTTDQRAGLNYGSELLEQRIRIRNGSSRASTVTLRLLASQPPTSPGSPSVAGPVALSRLIHDPTSADPNRQIRWESLGQDESLSQKLPPGQLWTLRLAVRREAMVGQSAEGSIYQSLLEVTDDTFGVRSILPVSCEGLASGNRLASHNSRSGLMQQAAAPPQRTGLWAGDALVSHVSLSLTDDPTPQPVAYPFRLRLIVHVDTNGAPRLLRDVLHLWKPELGGTNKSENGTHILFSGSPGRDIVAKASPPLRSTESGETFGRARRMSSAAFGFDAPITFRFIGSVKEFGQPAAELEVEVPMGFDDPLNPFKHRFHPDHDNLDDRYEKVVRPDPAAKSREENYDIVRTLRLRFTEMPPDEVPDPEWRDKVLGGEYRETIQDVHRKPIDIKGTFLLRRISTISRLNE